MRSSAETACVMFLTTETYMEHSIAAEAVIHPGSEWSRTLMPIYTSTHTGGFDSQTADYDAEDQPESVFTVNGTETGWYSYTCSHVW